MKKLFDRIPHLSRGDLEKLIVESMLHYHMKRDAIRVNLDCNVNIKGLGEGSPLRLQLISKITASEDSK